RLVQGTYSQFHVLVVDDDRGLDLAGADHLNVDALFRQGTEHQAGNTYVAAHADTYDRNLADLVIRDDFTCADGWADLAFQQVQRAGEVVAVNRKRKVGRALDRLILQNHVDIDIGGCNRT